VRKTKIARNTTRNKGKNKNALIRNIAVLALSFIMLIGGVGCILADSMLNRIQFVPEQSASSKVETGPLFEPGTASEGTTSAKSGILGGLYHDDAVTNILLLGVDDYQENDIGRSDSMMLVSVDTRHKKMKLTSFMRDMYVAIPGHSSNRINVAYSDAGGGSAGAKLLVKTIEANFGTDIDRYVIVDNAAFNGIIDRLGGVTITLTAGEAKLVNQYSGDSKRNLTAGTFNLSGAQAHYYSRIRVIGDDFERTERQRKVFSSLVDKLKTSNLGTIYSALSDTLSLVTTNMTKNEIISMAGNSLTYLNFPISQERIPADNEYQSEKITIGGANADVLVPDLDKSGARVSSFIYEADIPTKTYQGD
jgi:polyisoprenyl-teichoic acid--peptidoglycan teichoic acid transferase